MQQLLVYRTRATVGRLELGNIRPVLRITRVRLNNYQPLERGRVLTLQTGVPDPLQLDLFALTMHYSRRRNP